jgi:hypothetical protein
LYDCNDFSNDIINIERNIRWFLVFEQRPDAPNYIARPPSIPADVLECLGRLKHVRHFGTQPACRCKAVGVDSGERLINLMSNRCGKLTNSRQSRDARQFRLRQLQSLLVTFALGYIHGHPDILGHLAVCLEEGLANAVDVFDRSIPQYDTKRNLVSLCFLNRLLTRFFDMPPIFRVDHLQEQFI